MLKFKNVRSVLNSMGLFVCLKISIDRSVLLDQGLTPFISVQLIQTYCGKGRAEYGWEFGIEERGKKRPQESSVASTHVVECGELHCCLLLVSSLECPAMI